MMKVPLLDLKAQYSTIRCKIGEAIERVVESQRFILGARSGRAGTGDSGLLPRHSMDFGFHGDLFRKQTKDDHSHSRNLARASPVEFLFVEENTSRIDRNGITDQSTAS